MQMAPNSLLIKTFFITAISLFLAALWVPVNSELIKPTPQYYYADVLWDPAPRAVLGTLVRVFSLSKTGFIVFLQLCQFMWLLLLLSVLAMRAAGGHAPFPLFAVSALGFLFTFNSVVYSSNSIAGLIDVAAYLIILISAILLLYDRRFVPWKSGLLRQSTAVLLSILAVLIHEKSLFDITIIGVWLYGRYGLKAGLGFVLPTVGAAALFLGSVADNKTGGETVGDYFNIIPDALDFMVHSSFNLYGILLGGGMLWIVFVMAARRFVMDCNVLHRRAEKRRRLITVMAMAGLCLTPLVVAIDTNRMVGLIWLPTFLLVREVGFVREFQNSARLKRLVLSLCLMQILLPPLFIYGHGAVPLNCYSEGIISLARNPNHKADGMPTPLTLNIHDRTDITKGNKCWPPWPVR